MFGTTNGSCQSVFVFISALFRGFTVSLFHIDID